MMNEVLAGFLRANLVGAAAVLAVLALRLPVRRWLGAEVAYRLWIAPPLCAFATLMPARFADDVTPGGRLAEALGRYTHPMAWAWAAGAVLTFAGFAWAQARFLAEARAGRGGPSVVGVVAPRILMPPDDGRYSAEERALIRAHEHEHVVRRDPQAGAIACALQSICWFNPLAHVGAHAMRLDQELACDAAVLRRRPKDRALYAKTLLKTQLAAQPLPFGCYWPSRSPHPLEVRIGLLKGPAAPHDLAGPVAIGLGLCLSAVLAWWIQPPMPRHPPPIEELWQYESRGPVMSVVLITLPRDHR